MRTWRLKRPNLSGQLDVSRATGLVAAIGGSEPNAFAAERLKLFDDALAVTLCTIFADEFGNRPRTVSVADHRDGRYLRDAADTSVRHFHALDGNQQIVSVAARSAATCCCISRPATRSATTRIARPATVAPTYPIASRC